MGGVSLDDVRSDGASAARTAQNAPTAQPAATPARRIGRKGWKDPRLWVGVALVAVSVVAGARILGALDQTVAVWAPREPLVSGLPVPADGFEKVRVTFADPSEVDRYARVSAGAPRGYALRDVAAGELLPRAAVSDAPAEALTSISMELPSAQVPASVRAGARVDVWVVPEVGAAAGGEADQSAGRTRRLAREVMVLEAPVAEVLGAATSTRQVVIGVPEELPEQDLVLLIEAAGGSRVLLTGREAP